MFLKLYPNSLHPKSPSSHLHLLCSRSSVFVFVCERDLNYLWSCVSALWVFLVHAGSGACHDNCKHLCSLVVNSLEKQSRFSHSLRTETHTYTLLHTEKSISTPHRNTDIFSHHWWDVTLNESF